MEFNIVETGTIHAERSDKSENLDIIVHNVCNIRLLIKGYREEAF